MEKTNMKLKLQKLNLAGRKAQALKALLLVAALLLAPLLTGCTADEIGFVTAMAAAPEKVSYEYEGSIRLSVNLDIVESMDKAAGAPGLSFRPNVLAMRQAEASLQNVGLDINTKYMGSGDNLSGAFETQITPVALGGRLEDFQFGLWADVDMSDSGNKKLAECFKLPKALTKGVMWDVMKGKEYLTIDYDELESLLNNASSILGDGADAGTAAAGTEIGEIADINKLMDKDVMSKMQAASKKLAGSLKQSFVQIASLLKTQSAYILGVDRDGAGNCVYHIKITDKGLKDFAKSVVKIEKGDAKKILRAYLEMFVEYFEANPGLFKIVAGDSGPAAPDASVGDVFDSVMSEFDTYFDLYYPELMDVADGALKSSRFVKLLGDGGVTLDVHVSGDGFVTGTDFNADIVVDLRGYEIAAGNRFAGDLRKINVALSYSGKYTNINEDVAVVMPETTGRNAVSFSNVMEMIGALGAAEKTGGAADGADGQ